MQKLSEKVLKSMRGAILGAMVVLLVLTFGVTALVLRPKIDTLLETVARTKAGEIDYFLGRRLNEMTLLRKAYRPDATWEENLAAFQTYSEMLGVYASLGLVDETGVVHTTAGNHFSIRERSYYREACQGGQPYVLSQSIFSREDNQPVVIVLMPLQNGQFFSGAIGVEYVQEVIRGDEIPASQIRIVNTQGETEMETGAFAAHARIYEAEIPTHPGWTLQIGVSPLYMDGIFYLLGAFLLVVFWLLYRRLNKVLARRVAAGLLPLEAMARDMASTDLTNPPPLQIQADSQETQAILTGYESLRGRIGTLIKEVKAEQKSRMDSDYQALLEQIKPHFLYNTLETIQVMALDYEDDRVGDALGLLARYFRLSLADGAQTVTLQQELALVRTYVELQKLRYGDRLALRIETDLPAERYQIVKFILQPLVENALYHGIKLLDKGGCITVRAREEAGWLVLQVENPCPQPDPARLEELAACLRENRKPAGSNGLYNVNQRLRLRCGRQCLFLTWGGDWVRAEIRLKQEECYEDPDRG